MKDPNEQIYSKQFKNTNNLDTCHICAYTVKPVLSGHSKIDKTKILIKKKW